jgi:hypothetical protein
MTLVVALVACAEAAPQPAPAVAVEPTPPPPTAEAAPRPAGRVYPLPDPFAGGMGCTPSGEPTTIEGELVVQPFGKGSEGARLVASDGAWVLSYRAEGPLRELAGKHVRVRGRPCNKRGEAVSGRHFAAEALIEP